MSSIEEMIAEFCPHGVEYKCLGDIGSICMCKRIMKNQTSVDGDVPFYKIGTFGGKADAYISIELFEEYKEKYSYPKIGDILISAAGTIGRTIIFDGEPSYFQDSNIVWIDNDEKLVMNKFLYYYYQLQPWQVSTGGTIARLYNDNIARARLPVPPLEVQREIVHVLDSFTLLTAELTAELTARKKQYEFYRNKMLTFDTNVTRKRLGEIFDFRNGLSKGKEFFGSGTPFIRYTDVYNHRSLRKEDITALVDCTPSELEKLRVSRGDVLFTRTSETAEDVGWSSVMLDDIGDCVFNGFTIKATPKTDDLLPEYCAYCFATDSFRNYVTTHCAFTTRASLTGNTIAEYQIAIPSIDEQQRIANVLGNFEAICSDLNIGLPAEIAARQKQYEYYRDKLLSFEEVK